MGIKLNKHGARPALAQWLVGAVGAVHVIHLQIQYNIILVCLYSAFLLVHRTQGALHNITPADLYIPEPSQLPGKHTRCSSLLGEHTQHSTISITVYSRVPILNTPGWSEETRSKVRFPSVHKATKRRVEPTTLRSRVQCATTRPLLSLQDSVSATKKKVNTGCWK